MGLHFEIIEKFKSLDKVGAYKYSYSPAERNKYIFSVEQRESGKTVIKNFVDWLEEKYPAITAIEEINESIAREYLRALKEDLKSQPIASATKENKMNCEMSILNKVLSFEMRKEHI